MGKRERKINIPMCAAFILFVLTLISMHLTSGLYARYTATGTGSDGARVAKFQVLSNAVKQDIVVDCTKSNSEGYQITVTNNSEVAVRYSIAVKFNEKVNATALMIKMDGGSFQYPNSDSVISFSNVGTLAPNGASRSHTLEFAATIKEITSKVQGAETANWPLGFTVTVHAEQID